MVRQLDEIGCLALTLIGGEYFLYPQWKELLIELSKTKIKVGIVTNALALNDEKLNFLKQMCMRGIGISIDGAKAETHDYIRKVPGCYKYAWEMVKLTKEKQIPVTVITTINKLNIEELKAFRELMLKNGYTAWQIEHSNLFGRMKTELAIDEFGFYCVGIFAAQTKRKYAKDIRLFCMHNFGYYSKTIPNHVPNKYWTGCMAGKKNLGIRSDGSILGCLSLYEDKYIEGNVKEKSIKEIRKDKCFCSWNHRLEKFKNLTGYCAECVYGLVCLRGCEAFTSTQQQLCYHAIEQKWKENVPNNPDDKILQELTQGHMDKEGNFYLKNQTKITDEWIDALDIDSYHKNILKIIS